ncbi:P-loop containing nucleoside triphosphate hydrolase protein, partial [Tuber borchii]
LEMNSQSSTCRYHPPRCHTPDTNDEFEEPPPGLQSPGSGMLPPGNPQMPGGPQVPGSPQMPGLSQAPGYLQILSNPQAPGNPQTSSNPQIPHNPQIPGNQQIPSQQQIASSSQMTLYPQMPSNLQISGYPQMPSYPQMPGNTQMAGNPQAPGTPQIHSNPQMAYPQMPSNLQMPGCPQFPGYPQMPGYYQLPGYPQIPGYPPVSSYWHPELHLYPLVQHQIYGSALPPDNSTPSCPHTTSLNPNVQSPGMGNVGSLPTAPPKVSPGAEIIIALMGVTGAGKSYFIREVTGNSAVEVSGDLYPCTNKVQSYSFEYAGARITLVDTPGFNGMNRSDTKVLRMIGDWASEAYRNSQLLSGIIYLHPITHTRMEGSTLKNLRTLQSLCGQEALENVLLTTTQWSRVNWVEGEFRESRLRIREFWGGLIEKGATLQRFAGTRASGLELIHKLMLNKRKPLHIQNQMIKQHMTLLETDAGKCINELLVEQKKKHKEEVESLSLEHQEAMKAKEDEMNEILAAEQAKAQKKLEEAAAEKELLAESHAAEVKKREAEERERREEAAAYTKSLEEQLVAE